MDLDELAIRLGIDDNAMQQKQAMQQQDQFLGGFGPALDVTQPGVRDVGVAILNELSRRGEDTSAAGQAVQTILDQMRQEVEQTSNIVQMYSNALAEMQKKVSNVEDSVLAATGAAPSLEPTIGAPGGMEGVPPLPPEANAASALPPAMPPGIEGEMGPPPAGMEPPPPEEAMPPDMPPEGAPPQPIISDERLKSIKDRVAAAKATAPKPAAKPTVWKPSRHLIGAAIGGI